MSMKESYVLSLQVVIAVAAMLAIPIRSDYRPFMPQHFWPLDIAAFLVMGISVYNSLKIKP